MLKDPIQVYRDLLWDSPSPIRWVQGQILAVIVRFVSVVLLPPALYRIASPWLVAASRAIAPACLVAGSWWPALEALRAGGRGASGSAGAKLDSSGSHAIVPGDEYIEFSLRWYPLMDIAFTYIHPTSMLVEAVYGIFSVSCVLLMGLPGLPGKRLPRGFFLPYQLAKCALSTAALLAIERWRLLHAGSSAGGSGGGRGGGSNGGRSGGGGSGAAVAALMTLKGAVEVESEEAAAAAVSRVGGTLGGGGECGDAVVCGDAVGCGDVTQEEEGVEAGGLEGWYAKEQQGQQPPQGQERPRPTDSKRTDPPRTNGLRLVAAETRRFRGCATRTGSTGSSSGGGGGGGCRSGGGAGVTSGDGSGSGGSGWAAPLDPHDTLTDPRLTLHPQLRAVHHQLSVALPGLLPVDSISPPLALQPPSPHAGVAAAAGAVAEPQQQQQQQVLLNARALPRYVPHRVRFQSAVLGTQRNGSALLQEGVPDLLLPPPLPPSGSQQQQPVEAEAVAAATAAAQVRRQEPLPGAHHIPYTCRTTLYSTRIKIDGCEPEQVAPGYVERISRVVAAAGMQLEAVTLRRGCIELIIETRAVDAAPVLGQEPATLPGSQSQQTLATAADSAYSAAAAAAGAAPAAGGESSSDCRSTLGPGSSLWEGRSESTIGADAAPVDAFDDVLDIGTLIRALQLPDTSSLEWEVTSANEDERDRHDDNGGALEGAREEAGWSWAEAGAAGGAEGGEDAGALTAAMATAAAAGDWWDDMEASNAGGGGDWGGGGVDVTHRRDAQGRQQAGRQRSGGAGAPAADSAGASRQVLLPYVIDVYPRVLLVGPASGSLAPPSVHHPLQQHASQQAAAAAAAAAAASNVTSLVVLLSWVPSSHALVPEPSSDLAAAASTADPRVADAAAGRACSSPPAQHQDQDSFTAPTGAVLPPDVTAGAGVAATATATATEAPGVAGLDAAADSGPQPHGTVAVPAEAGAVHPHAVPGAPASQPCLSSARILLRFHGEVVAVAAVTPSAATVVMAAPVAELRPPPPPQLRMLAAPGGGFESAGSAAAGRGGDGAENAYRSPWAEAAAFAMTASGGGGGGFGAAEGGGPALGSDVLYSVDASPLLSRLGPGILLVEANRDLAPQYDTAVAGAAAAGHRSPVVPVLTVDDPWVAAELQQASDNWYGTADDLDSLLYDLGALLRLQDELTACAAALADGGGAGGGATLLHLSALSARTQMLYNHLVLHAEAMSWDAARAWLRARQLAAAAAVAAANAAAALRCATPAVGGSVLVTGPAVATAAATAAAIVSASKRLEPAGKAAAPLPPGGAVPTQIDTGSSSRRLDGSSSNRIGSSRRLVGTASSPLLQRLLRLLRLVLGWQSDGEGDAAAYAAHTALVSERTMGVMQVVDLMGLLTAFMAHSAAPPPPAATGAAASDVTGGGGGGPWRVHADKACALVAASTGLVTCALLLTRPRPEWRRIAAHVKWPRQLSYTLAKVAVAFLGFPQPPWTIRHELGASIFIVEGIILPAAALMSPMESVAMGLIRAPLCARMWLLAGGDSNHHHHHHQYHQYHQQQYTVLAASLRALALSSLSVATTVAAHMFIRMSYERRRRRGASPHAKTE